MAISLYQEAKLFKKVFNHDNFGQHDDELRLPQPVWLSGIKFGAVKDGNQENPPYILVFARNLSSLESARFTCLVDKTQLSGSGIMNIRPTALVTDHLRFRGCYKNLPVAVYGSKYVPSLPPLTGEVPLRPMVGVEFDEEAASQAHPPHEVEVADTPLPEDVLVVLQPFLRAWRQVKADPRRIRKYSWADRDLQALVGRANDACDIVGLGGKCPYIVPVRRALPKEDAAVKDEADLEKGDLDADIELADMAACWISIFSSSSETAGETTVCLAGLSTAVLLASSPRYAERFVVAEGIPALSCILDLLRPPSAILRFTLSALLMLTSTLGAVACEVMLDWWTPPSLEALEEAMEVDEQVEGDMDQEDLHEEVDDIAQGLGQPSLAASQVDGNFEDQLTPPYEGYQSDMDVGPAAYQGPPEGDVAQRGAVHSEENGAREATSAASLDVKAVQKSKSKRTVDDEGAKERHKKKKKEKTKDKDREKGKSKDKERGDKDGDAEKGKEKRARVQQKMQEPGPPERVEERNLPPDTSRSGKLDAGRRKEPMRVSDGDQVGKKGSPGRGGHGGDDRPQRGRKRSRSPSRNADKEPAGGRSRSRDRAVRKALDRSPDRGRRRDKSPAGRDTADVAPERTRARDGGRDARDRKDGPSERPRERDREPERKMDGSKDRRDQDRSRSRDRDHDGRGAQAGPRDRLEGRGDREDRNRRDVDKDRDREREREKERDKERERDRLRERERDRDKEREREKDKDREAERVRERDREKQRGRDKRQTDLAARDRSRDGGPLSPESRGGGDRDRGLTRTGQRGSQDGRGPARDFRDRGRQPDRERAEADHDRARGDRGRDRDTAHDRGRGESRRSEADKRAASHGDARFERKGSTGPDRSHGPTSVRVEEDERPQNSTHAPGSGAPEDEQAVLVTPTNRHPNAKPSYGKLVDLLLQPIPEKIAEKAAELIARLAVYEAAANFEKVAEQLVEAIAVETPLEEKLVRQGMGVLAACLNKLVKALTASAAPRWIGTDRVSVDPSGKDELGLRELQRSTVQLLSSRRLLSLLAGAMHAPALHVYSNGDAVLASKPRQCAGLQVTLAQPLLLGTKRLLALLLSSKAGMSFLLDNMRSAHLLLQAMDPILAPNASLDDNSTSRGPLKDTAKAVQGALAAAQAAAKVADAQTSTEDRYRLLVGLSEMAAIGYGRRSVVNAFLTVPGAVAGLSALLQDPLVKVSGMGDGIGGPELSFWRPESVYAGRVLMDIFKETHPQVAVQWLEHGQGIRDVIISVLDLPGVQELAGERERRWLRELRGRIEPVLAYSMKGVLVMVTSLDSILPPLVPDQAWMESEAAAHTDAKHRKNPTIVEFKAAVDMLLNGEKSGAAESMLALLRMGLTSHRRTNALNLLTDTAAAEVLERALRMAVVGLVASNADEQRMMDLGEQIEDERVIKNRLRLGGFIATAAGALNAWLHCLRERGIELKRTIIVDVLVHAYTTIMACPESLLTHMGQLPGSGGYSLLQARMLIVDSLQLWLDRHSWEPSLLAAVFAGEKSYYHSPKSSEKTPREWLGILCLLGDLMPSEWPSTPTYGKSLEPHPAPTDLGYRTLLLRAFAEDYWDQLPALVRFAIKSESRIGRAALVRFCARAAGLGGEMGMRLIEPIVTELQLALGSKEPGPPALRVVEVLVPLVYRPALKVAMLQLGLIDVLGGLIMSLANREEGSRTVCTMALEVANALVNHEVSLNPSLPLPRRLNEDTPPLEQTVAFVVMLLQQLNKLGANAHLAKRIIQVLGGTQRGRQAIRAACTRWMAQSTQQPSDQVSSLQWAVNQLWDVGVGSDDSDEWFSGIRKDLATALEGVAKVEDMDEDEMLRPPPPPAERFAQALAASKAASGPQGTDTDLQRISRPVLDIDSDLESLVLDPATTVFWRNVNTRKLEAPKPYRPGESAENHIEIWNLPPDVPIVSVASTISTGLTKVMPLQIEKVTIQREALEQSVPAEGQNAVKAVPKVAVSPMGTREPVGSAIPPVIAPTGRMRQQARGRTTGATGRAPAKHVDEFERQAAERKAAAAALTGFAKTGQPKAPTVRIEGEGLTELTPSALQGLMAKPDLMQKVLEQNPELLSVLKSRMGT